MQKLNISLISQDHPFQNDPDAFHEAWGKITIQILNEFQVFTLKVVEWDVLCLAEWFIENANHIASEKFDVLGEILNGDESISEAMYRIRIQKFHIPSDGDNLSNDVEDLMDNLANAYDSYYERHSLRTNLGGSKMPEILLGIRDGGVGEISLFSENESWRYEFDMSIFMDSFIGEIKKYIRNWLEKTNDSDARRRGVKIWDSIQQCYK